MKNAICWNMFLYGMLLLELGNCPATQIMPIKEKGTTWNIAVVTRHLFMLPINRKNVCSAPYSKAIVKQYAVSETELSGCILYFKAKIWKTMCEIGVFLFF